jgi:hypothetical protein
MGRGNFLQVIYDQFIECRDAYALCHAGLNAEHLGEVG